MAKIIGYRKLEKPKYQGTCEECGAIILFEEKELKDGTVFSSGTCPKCENTVLIDKRLDKYNPKQNIINYDYSRSSK